MHPLVAIVASSAAEGFGQEVGKEVAKRLFGQTKGGDMKAVSAQLKKIRAELVAINGKLDLLLGLVEALPEIIMGRIEILIVDRGYEALEGDRAAFDAFAARHRGRIAVPTVSEQGVLHSHWMAIVKLESRFEMLMLLPALTEYLRERFVYPVDDTFRVHLEQKRDAIDKAIVGYKQKLDAALASAQSELDHAASHNWGHFGTREFFGDPPMIRYELATRPDPGPFGRGMMRAWLAAQQDSVRSIELKRKAIEAQAATLKTAVVARELLDTYIPYLDRGGELSAPGLDWRVGAPGFEIAA